MCPSKRIEVVCFCVRELTRKIEAAFPAVEKEIYYQHRSGLVTYFFIRTAFLKTIGYVEHLW